MINKNEQIIRNYIFQIRRPFSLVQVTEDTGVAKTSCQRVLKRYLKEGKIVRTGDGCTPKLYRYVYPKAIKKMKQTTKSTKDTKVVRSEKLGVRSSREAEVQAKADELGITPRSIYRREKKTRESKLKVVESINNLSNKKSNFSVYDLAESSGLYPSEVSALIPILVSEDVIKLIANDGSTSYYGVVNHGTNS